MARPIGLIGVGDMGAAIGRRLIQHGLQVVTALDGRSEAGRRRARQAGIEDAGGLADLGAAVRLVLGVLPPAQALAAARTVATVLGDGATYADLNAISPETAGNVNSAIEAAGLRFADGSIIGGPPERASDGSGPRIYLCGDAADSLAFLDGYGLDIRIMNAPVGAASALKMCYAAMTKGTTALQLAMLATAQRAGVGATLAAELAGSQAQRYARMQSGIPAIPAKSGRWVHEMEQIADTFRANGLPDGFHRAAATVFRQLSRTQAAGEEADAVDRDRTLDETLRQFLEAGE